MDVRLREWASRAFIDPEPVLRQLRQIELAAVQADMPDRVRRLRTNALKEDKEARLACIFAYGMRAVVGTTVFVSPGETEDCDFLTRATVGETTFYHCVQLKELAPADLNPSQSLASLLEGINKRSPSDAVLAIHLNRRTSIPIEQLAAAHVPFSELWFYWAADPTHTAWRLLGGAPGSFDLYDFEYPW